MLKLHISSYFTRSQKSKVLRIIDEPILDTESARCVISYIFAFRKYYSGYLRGFPDVAKLRSELMKFDKIEPIVEKLEKYLAIISEKFV